MASGLWVSGRSSLIGLIQSESESFDTRFISEVPSMLGPAAIGDFVGGAFIGSGVDLTFEFKHSNSQCFYFVQYIVKDRHFDWNGARIEQGSEGMNSLGMNSLGTTTKLN